MAVVRAEREWLELVADLLAAPLFEMPEERLASQLVRTFGLTGAAYHYRRPGRPVAVQRVWPVEEQFGGRRAELQHWGVHCAPAGHPLLRYYLATGDPRPMHVWDVPDRFADRQIVAGWREIGGSWGSASQLAVPLHMSRHSHRTFVLGRADPFTPAELRLARTLHRLIVGLDRQIGAVRGRIPDPAADPALTPRESAVLALVADGLTAAAIAHRLLMAERTVGKHLERVYSKLGVHDRLGAVLRAHRLGLLAPR